MNQPTSEIKSQHKEEKEPYITPELVKKPPLRDMTMLDSTQIDPPSLQLE